MTSLTECGAAFGAGPCQYVDLHLVNVHAHSWALVFPLFFYVGDLRIDGEAVQVPLRELPGDTGP